MSQLMHLSPFLVAYLLVSGVVSTNFTILNNCSYTIWPGINSTYDGRDIFPKIPTGFSLGKNEVKTISTPDDWDGRLWGRTHCTEDDTGRFSCITGDCGSGKIECPKVPGSSPVTMAEFKLNYGNGLDFFNVNLLHGYNLPLVVVPSKESCKISECVVDLNVVCPSELMVKSSDGKIVGCRSACEAFGTQEYCCNGDYDPSYTCKPTSYSKIYKKWCPGTYPLDNETGTFSCASSDYQITFCAGNPIVYGTIIADNTNSPRQSQRQIIPSPSPQEKTPRQEIKPHSPLQMTPRQEIKPSPSPREMTPRRLASIIAGVTGNPTELYNNTSKTSNNAYETSNGYKTIIARKRNSPPPVIGTVIANNPISPPLGTEIVRRGILTVRANNPISPPPGTGTVTRGIVRVSPQNSPISPLPGTGTVIANNPISPPPGTGTVIANNPISPPHGTGTVIANNPISPPHGTRTVIANNSISPPPSEQQIPSPAPQEITPSPLPRERRPNTTPRRLAPIIAGVIGSALLIIFFVVILILRPKWWRKSEQAEEDVEEDHIEQVPGMPVRFSYKEIFVATDNFKERLGRGGFGSVFRGKLSDGTQIAVKRLEKLGQGVSAFLAEAEAIGSLHHFNLVRLIGFCAEKSSRLLVFEYLSNGSLDKWIFMNVQRSFLDWRTRKKIILDVAKGLAYLHEDCRHTIIHLDVKPQNILLDSNFHAKIADFGLSKLINRDMSQVQISMRGTPGYLAPEWSKPLSHITVKVDTYSFGIVLLEIVCARRNVDESQPESAFHLLTLLQKKADQDRVIDIVENLDQYMQSDREEITRMIKVAAWCLQDDPERRPLMSTVLKVLEGVMEVDSNLSYRFSHALISSPAVNNHVPSSPPPASVLSYPR